jgi:hypothetical protein
MQDFLRLRSSVSRLSRIHSSERNNESSRSDFWNISHVAPAGVPLFRINISDTLESGEGISFVTMFQTPFGNELLMHTLNTILALLHFVMHFKCIVYLQRLGTSLWERRPSVTEFQARTHQALYAILKRLECDQALKFRSTHSEIQKWQLTYGEIVDPCGPQFQWEHASWLLADKALNHFEFHCQVRNIPTFLEIQSAHLAWNNISRILLFRLWKNWCQTLGNDKSTSIKNNWVWYEPLALSRSPRNQEEASA